MLESVIQRISCYQNIVLVSLFDTREIIQLV